MRRSLRTLILVGAAWASITVSTEAMAATAFNWRGDCTLGCSGVATGILTLSQGNPLQFETEDFISFQFNSSSGQFLLTNSSPYLIAQGGGWAWNGKGVFLEENALAPGNLMHTLPLWQFVSTGQPDQVLTQSPGENAWQFLSGNYDWNCLNQSCTSWTDDVTRNVGVNGGFLSIGQEPGVPEPSTWATLMLGFGFISWSLRFAKRKTPRKAPLQWMRGRA